MSDDWKPHKTGGKKSRDEAHERMKKLGTESIKVIYEYDTAAGFNLTATPASMHNDTCHVHRDWQLL